MRKMIKQNGVLYEMLQFLLQIRWWLYTLTLLILLLFVLFLVFTQGPGVAPLHDSLRSLSNS